MRTPSVSPTRVASGTPPVVSWSVRAIATRPAACARRATSAGGYSPSEAVEWQCRSTRAVGTFRRGPGRLRLPEQLHQLPLGELGQGGVGTAAAHRRVAREATTPLGTGPLLEDHAELVAVVHGHASRGGYLPRPPVHDDRSPRHGPSPTTPRWGSRAKPRSTAPRHPRHRSRGSATVSRA